MMNPAEDKANILLVDDQPENLIALEAILGDLGQNLVMCRSGEDALRQLLRSEFAVIVLDVMMPGINGFETAAHIRKREATRFTPIIFLTALDRGELQVRESYEVGAVDYIVKPFIPEELRWKVQVFVDLYLKNRQIIHLKQIEQLYRELEIANTAKMNFLAMVSHELRTPLTSIKGFVTTLLQPDLQWSQEQLNEFLGIIDNETDNVINLVNELLDMSRLLAGALGIAQQPVSVGEILAHAMPELNMMCDAHQLIIDAPDTLPIVDADKQRVAQVISNLVGNACQYSPPNTEITLTCSATPRFVRVDIHDQGSGIPADEQAEVFEVFHQGANKIHKGLGLGLAISRGIIEAHRCELWVDSSSEDGTTISFNLPVAAQPLPSDAE